LTSVADDPFAVLGLGPDATLDEVRAARRRLAWELHPDRGGDASRMREVNEAFDAAVRTIRAPRRVTPTPPPPPASSPPSPRPPLGARWVGRWVDHDEPSFAIAVLPVDAFEALLVVVSWHGELLDDDPPYLLLAHLYDPAECVVRLTLVPEAGASMVSVSVAAVEGGPWPPPTAEAVRDLLITGLNQLGSE
jgi:hypothetical protein